MISILSDVPQEASTKPKAELRKLAKKPRPPLYDQKEIPTEPIPEAVEWYQERLQDTECTKTDPTERKIPLNFLPDLATVLGNVRLKVWHDGNLDEDKIRKLYHELKDGNQK